MNSAGLMALNCAAGCTKTSPFMRIYCVVNSFLMAAVIFFLIMAITIRTYNLHGYNQGKVFLPTLCCMSDTVLVQEHWLYDDELGVFDNIRLRYCVCMHVSYERR